MANLLPPDLPPHNNEVEQALLGALLMAPKQLEHVADFLRPEHFYHPLHNLIFETMLMLSREGKAVDAMALRAVLRGMSSYDDVGGDKYLATISTAAVTTVSSSVKHYGEVLADLSMRRDMIEYALILAADCRDSIAGRSAREILDKHETALLKLSGARDAAGGLVPFHEVLSLTVSDWEAETKGRRGTPTGFIELDNLLGGLHPTDLIILAGRPSMGKEQPLDANILLANGLWKRMGDIQIGDWLASVDGDRSRVTGVFPQGRKDVYRITFSDGRSTECGAEHLWEVSYKGWSRSKVLTTAALQTMLRKPMFKSRLRIPVVSGDFGSEFALPLDPWCVGALLANGGFTDGGTPGFSTADPATLRRLKRGLGRDLTLKADGNYTWRIPKSGSRHHDINPLKAALDSLELWGLRSEEKFIPPTYLNASKDARLELLRGLLDTDGWVEKFGAVRYGTSSRRLALDVQYLVRSLGGLCRITTKLAPKYLYKGERRTGLQTWVCNISHKDKGGWIKLLRKKARTVVKRAPALTITSIRKTRVAKTQCIRVSHPRQLYVTDDFIVTHNTALAVNIAFNAAMYFQASEDLEHRNRQVAFFSLEMATEQLGSRIITGDTRIVAPRNRWGDPLKEHEWAAAIDAASRLGTLPFWVDDTPDQTVSRLRARCIRLHRKKPIGLIVIDYLQLLDGDGKSRDSNRVAEISQITRGLKKLAKELQVPVLALSQLSRGVESRENKRPMLSDLRESGSIEQDADIILFPFRAEYYLNQEGKPQRRSNETEAQYSTRTATYFAASEASAGKCEVIVAKQRHGPVGSAWLHYDKSRTWFENVAPEEPPPQENLL